MEMGTRWSSEATLGGNPDSLALKAESANPWHRRMGHMNGKSLDVLRKEPGNGVDYTGAAKDCDSCPLGKSTQQPRPNQATYGVLRPFQLTTVAVSYTHLTLPTILRV